MRWLPAELRETVKEPIGCLARNDQELIRLLKGKKTVVSVGDRVTFTVLSHGIRPFLCIVDFVIERRSATSAIMETIRRFTATRISVKNPQGCLTDELWDAIASCYKNREKGPFCIEVEGEEDLASLAAICLAPSDVTVIYGLPNTGVLVVQPTRAHKKKVKKVLDQMCGTYGSRDSVKEK